MGLWFATDTNGVTQATDLDTLRATVLPHSRWVKLADFERIVEAWIRAGVVIPFDAHGATWLFVPGFVLAHDGLDAAPRWPTPPLALVPPHLRPRILPSSYGQPKSRKPRARASRADRPDRSDRPTRSDLIPPNRGAATPDPTPPVNGGGAGGADPEGMGLVVAAVERLAKVPLWGPMRAAMANHVRRYGADVVVRTLEDSAPTASHLVAYTNKRLVNGNPAELRAAGGKRSAPPDVVGRNPAECPTCQGFGALDMGKGAVCPACGGDGLNINNRGVSDRDPARGPGDGASSPPVVLPPPDAPSPGTGPG